MVTRTVALALISVPRLAWAQGRSPSARGCDERYPTAIGQVGCELARGLGTSDRPALVIPSSPVLRTRAERADAIAVTLAKVVAGELGPRARASEVVRVQSALPRVDRDTQVVWISTDLSPEKFSATADLLRTPGKFWERFRLGASGTQAHGYAVRALDAELRSYLPRVPLVVSRVDKATAADEPVIAVACGDVDGDGSIEIVSVGRRRIQLGRLVQGAFSVFRSANWTDLSAVAPRPLREPIAAAVVRGPFVLDVGITDRADALRLDGSLQVTRRFAEQLPWAGSECATISGLGLAPERSRCTDRSRPTPASGTLDAIGGARVVRRDGSALELFAERGLDGHLTLEFGNHAQVLEGTVGAQIAIGDLDGDGRPELLTSSDTLEPSSDQLLVRTLNEDGKLSEAFRLPVSTGIRALGLCPNEGGGLSPIVLATGDGFWVLR